MAFFFFVTSAFFHSSEVAGYAASRVGGLFQFGMQ